MYFFVGDFVSAITLLITVVYEDAKLYVDRVEFAELQQCECEEDSEIEGKVQMGGNE